MILIRPFKKEDLDFTPIEALAPVETEDELAQAMEDSNLAVTGIKDGKIIGCGGVHPVDERTGEVWIRLSQDCLGFKIGTLRVLKEGFKIMEEIYPFEVLMTTVKCCFGDSVNLIERFGFTRIKEVMHENEKWFIYRKII